MGQETCQASLRLWGWRHLHRTGLLCFPPRHDRRSIGPVLSIEVPAWRNEWFYDEGNGVRAETFGTLEEAWDALDEFFADIAEDIKAGHCPPCGRAEFRVREIITGCHCRRAFTLGGAP